MGAPNLKDKMLYESLVSGELRPHLDWQRIAVCDGSEPQEVLGLALLSGFTHVCQQSHPYFAADLNTAASMLADAKNFLSFPMSTIFDPTSVNTVAGEKQFTIYEKNFDQIRQKSGILIDVKDALDRKSISRSIVTDVVSIADELVTNAVFNAPFVDLANTLPGASREDQSVRMEQGKRGQIFVGADATRLVIGCRDPYGTLNLIKLFERVKKCYDTSLAESLNTTGSGGAGIGSFMVFMSSVSYYAIVSENHCTMICCALPLRMSGRVRAGLPKNLHFSIKK